MQPLCAPPATASEDGEGGSGVRPPGSGSAVAGARLGPLQTASRGPPPPENDGSSGARGQPLEDCRREDESCATVLPTGAGKALAAARPSYASAFNRAVVLRSDQLAQQTPPWESDTAHMASEPEAALPPPLEPSVAMERDEDSRRIALMHKGKIVMRAPAQSTDTLRQLRRQHHGATAPARKRVKTTHRVDG